MTSKEALATLGNVRAEVVTIRTGITIVKSLKEVFEKEFEVLEKELLFVRDIKPFDVYEEQYKKLEKVIEILKDYLMIKVSINRNNEYCLDACDYAIPHLNKEQYDLLKEYL